MSIQDVIPRLKTTFRGSIARPAALIGIIVAVAAPFVLLTIGGREANNLPWYVWTIIPLLLLAVIEVGIVMFRRGSHYAEDISISPRRR